jgi:hypothetical protein
VGEEVLRTVLVATGPVGVGAVTVNGTTEDTDVVNAAGSAGLNAALS